MPTFPIRPALIAAALILGSARPARAQATPMPFLETTGWGQVRLTPNRASVTIGVETQAQTARAASAENARIQRAVLDTLRAMGFADSMVTTRSFVVAPNFEQSQGRSVRNGYIGRNTVEVTITALGRVGDVIDAALARGATNVSNVGFSSTHSDSAQLAAISAATVNAQRQAQALATALGGTLGPLLQATTSVGRSSPLEYALRSSLEARPGTSINPAPINVDVTVSARWQYLGR